MITTTHRFLRTLAFGLILGCAPALYAADAPTTEPPGKPETYRPPKGAYQHLWIDFAGGDFRTGPQTITRKMFVGLRDGHSTTAWLLRGIVPGGVRPEGMYRVRVDKHQLKLTADKLTGSLELRQVSTWAPTRRLAMLTINIDAKRNGAEFAGTWSTQVIGGATTNGTLTGKLTDEAAIRASQAFAAGLDWPTYYGPLDANRAGDKGAAILDDLTQAKPLWRAEEPIGAGWGIGDNPTGRPLKLLGAGPCGGSSSPVFAGGRIFQFHYVPSGQADTGLVARTLELADKEAVNNKMVPPLTPMEKEIVTTGLRPLSDTILTCIDPQTGGTLWRTTVPRLSGNYQAHKWRGMNPTPTVLGNVVVVSDYGFNHLGLKAETGEVLWIIRGRQQVGVGSQSAPVRPVAAAGLAILHGGTAVKPETGEVVWKNACHGEILRWSSGGTDRLVVIGWKNIRCLDAATGQQLWDQPVTLQSAFASGTLISGDLLVGFAPVEDPKLRGHGKPQGWKLSATGMEKVWEEEILPNDENLTVSLGADRVYVQGREEVRAIELASGKRLATAKGKEAFPGLHGPGSNPWLCVIGDRVLLNPEGQHGKTGFLVMDRDLKPLSAWHPPHNHDTAYAYMAMISPVVDGRIFIRGTDGLYCYDLRKQQ